MKGVRVVGVRMEDVKVCGGVRVGVRMEDMCEEKQCVGGCVGVGGCIAHTILYPPMPFLALFPGSPG